MKRLNSYARELSDNNLYDATPKAVLAAIAVSALTCGGDQIEHAHDRVLSEWWALYEAGIVPQRPRKPRPSPTDGPMD
jgi:hypothetical protein